MLEKRGGPRANAGRKPLTKEQKQEREQEREQERRAILIDELLFPAVSMAFHCEPGQFGDRYLEVELSKVDIRLAYGEAGLREWMSFFSLEKIGGRTKSGQGYKSRWILNLNKYALVQKFVSELGHSLKDIPKVFFPPDSMVERLRLIHERREKKRIAQTYRTDSKI